MSTTHLVVPHAVQRGSAVHRRCGTSSGIPNEVPDQHRVTSCRGASGTTHYNSYPPTAPSYAATIARARAPTSSALIPGVNRLVPSPKPVAPAFR